MISHLPHIQYTFYKVKEIGIWKKKNALVQMEGKYF